MDLLQIVFFLKCPSLRLVHTCWTTSHVIKVLYSMYVFTKYKTFSTLVLEKGSQHLYLRLVCIVLKL